MDRQGVFSLLVLVVIAVGHAAPTTNNFTSPTSTKIPALKVVAMREIFSVLTEIQELETYRVR